MFEKQKDLANKLFREAATANSSRQAIVLYDNVLYEYNKCFELANTDDQNSSILKNKMLTYLKKFYLVYDHDQKIEQFIKACEQHSWALHYGQKSKGEQWVSEMNLKIIYFTDEILKYLLQQRISIQQRITYINKIFTKKDQIFNQISRIKIFISQSEALMKAYKQEIINEDFQKAVSSMTMLQYIETSLQSEKYLENLDQIEIIEQCVAISKFVQDNSIKISMITEVNNAIYYYNELREHMKQTSITDDDKLEMCQDVIDMFQTCINYESDVEYIGITYSYISQIYFYYLKLHERAKKSAKQCIQTVLDCKSNNYTLEQWFITARNIMKSCQEELEKSTNFSAWAEENKDVVQKLKDEKNKGNIAFLTFLNDNYSSDEKQKKELKTLLEKDLSKKLVMKFCMCFHPDKAKDQNDKMLKSEIQKHINEIYETNFKR